MKKALLSFCLFFTLGWSLLSAQCTIPAAGDWSSGIFVTSQYNYVNCHRYIRTALLNGEIDMNTGDFVSFPDIHPDSYSIASDDRFVIVCGLNDAEAICFTHLPGQPDHSALVLNPGIITGALGSFASTPGPGSSVYRHGEASIGSGGGTLMNYFAVMPEMNGSSTISSGSTEQYCLDYKGYIENVSWSVNGNAQISGSSSGFCVNLTATCPGGGTITLTATITVETTGETREITKEITLDCPLENPCNTNTIDGGPLYTFNYISPFVTHTIQMGTGWSWSISSGSPSVFQVLNGGQTVRLAISRGCVVLNAYNPSCGFRTYIFCPGFKSQDTEGGKPTEITKDQLAIAPDLDVTLYPNPARSEVRIQDIKSQDFRVRIYTTTGAVVGEYFNVATIALDEFVEGLYFVEVTDLITQQRSTSRLVVKR